MSFLSPLFLLGIAAVAIPFLLFRLRTRPPKELPFSTLAFLATLQKEALRTFRLRQWLLLLIRAAILLLFALAAARPILEWSSQWVSGNDAALLEAPAGVGAGVESAAGESGAVVVEGFTGAISEFAASESAASITSESPFASDGTRQILAILVDNSPSMGRMNGGSSLLTTLKNEWSDALIRLPKDTGVLIQTSNGPSLALRLLSINEAIRELQEIQVHSTADMMNVRLVDLERQLRLLTVEEQARGSIWFTTDGQRPAVVQTGEAPEFPLMIVRVLPSIPSRREGEKSVAATQGASASSREEGSGIDRWNVSVSDVLVKGDSEPVLQISIGLTPLFDQGADEIPSLYLSVYKDDQILLQREIQKESYRQEQTSSESEILIAELEVSTQPAAFDSRIAIHLEGDAFAADNRWFGVLRSDSGPRSYVHIKGTQGVADGVAEGSSEEYLSILLTGIRAQPFESWMMNDAENRLQDLSPRGIVVMEGLESIPAWFRTQILQWVRDGGTLWYVPALKGDASDLSAFLTGLGGVSMRSPIGTPGSGRSIDRISLSYRSEELLRGVFLEGQREALPDPLLHYLLPYEIPDALASSIVMKSGSGQPLVQEFGFGRGRVILSSIGFTSAWSELPLQPVFVPLMLNIISGEGQHSGGFSVEATDLVAPFSQSVPFASGQSVPFASGATTEGSKWVVSDGERSFEPLVTLVRSGVELRFTEPLLEPGFYVAAAGAAGAVAALSSAGAGIYSPNHLFAANLPVSESDFTLAEDLFWKTNFADFSTHIGILDAGDGSLAERLPGILAGEGVQLWHWMLLFALLLMILESVTAQRLSTHQTTESSSK